MTETPDAIVTELPAQKRRFHLPSKSTLVKAGALTGAFILGGVVAKRKLNGTCPNSVTPADESTGTDTDN